MNFGDSKFKDIGHMVRHLLKTEPGCHFDRNFLVTRVWEELDGLKFSNEQKQKIREATPVETITRLLRKKS